VEVEADDVDPEPLERVEPVVETAAAVGEPGVVLDPETNVPGRTAQRGEDAGESAGGERRQE
jgi:hypothetical protein